MSGYQSLSKASKLNSRHVSKKHIIEFFLDKWFLANINLTCLKLLYINNKGSDIIQVFRYNTGIKKYQKLFLQFEITITTIFLHKHTHTHIIILMYLKYTVKYKNIRSYLMNHQRWFNSKKGKTLYPRNFIHSYSFKKAISNWFQYEIYFIYTYRKHIKLLLCINVNVVL